jgi:NhaA family Na+:H+ antiporter
MIVRPLQEFLGTEASGGVLLLAAAALALAWANVDAANYADTWGHHAGSEIAGLHLELTLRDWVNDALMAVFFFVVGMEIKRELVQGELSDRRRAALPVAAALGGMAAPALIYVAINAGGDGSRGWGVPMATDIAFAVGVLALAGPRVPASLKVFLLALAIADDLGAIAVIALFYTDDLDVAWLLASAALIVVVVLAVRMGSRHMVLYVPLGIAMWVAVQESGVHATVAGVALGLLTPLAGAADGDGARGAGGWVLERLETALHPVSSFLIVPLFALANAGIELDGGVIRDAASSPVAVGAALGLMLGKPLGIALFSYAAVRLGIGALPEGVSWQQIGAVGIVAGIGFTVAIFIGNLAFSDTETVDEAKIGVLVGSAVMGVVGFAALRLVTRSE